MKPILILAWNPVLLLCISFWPDIAFHDSVYPNVHGLVKQAHQLHTYSEYTGLVEQAPQLLSHAASVKLENIGQDQVSQV